MQQTQQISNNQFRQFQDKPIVEQISVSKTFTNLEKQKQVQHEFKYYTKQKMDENGMFDMRFKTIKQSTIVKGAYDQFKFAASFQWKKNEIHKKNYHHQIFQAVPQKQFHSNPNQIKAYWLGHASVLLSIDSDTRIIIDPMFDKRLVRWVGQARHAQPPCKIDQLPKINCVLISHDHYDHCNTNSLESIYQKNQKDGIIFLIGKNSSDVLPKKCQINKHYKQLSWTQSQQLKINKKNIKITFVPACHWSKRTLFDQNKRLWGGFVIQALGKKIYFAGDTGYCELFNELKIKFGGFDLSLLPIGAYEPNEILKAQHVNPKEAVRIHNQINSKLSVGIHWGTFPMSHQKPQQVLEDLKQARKQLKQGEFRTIKIGQSVSINKQV